MVEAAQFVYNILTVTMVDPGAVTSRAKLAVLTLFVAVTLATMWHDLGSSAYARDVRGQAGLSQRPSNKALLEFFPLPCGH